MRFLFYLLPFILFYPQQYSQNLFRNFTFWIILIMSLINYPGAFTALRKEMTKAQIIFLIYIAVLLLSSLVSFSLEDSILWIPLFISYFIIFLVTPYVISSYKSKEVFSGIFLTICSVLSAISTYNTVVKGYVNTEIEGLSYMWVYWGHNHLAALLVLAIPLCLFFINRFYEKRTLRIVLIFNLIFLIYNMLLAFSRAGVISLLIILVLGGLFLKRAVLKKMGKYSKALLVLFFALMFLISFFIFSKKFSTGIESRFFYWQKGIEAGLNSPLLGTGPGTYRFIPKYDANFKYAKSAFALNLPIQIIAETGLLGLLSGSLLYAVLSFRFVSSLKKPIKTNSEALCFAICLGLLGILINEMFDFDLQIPAFGVIFWLFAGLVFDINDKNN